MPVDNILNTGIQGFQQATQRASQAAQEIASQSVTDATQDSVEVVDLTSSLVDLKAAELDALANGQVIETASDLIGTLLDITV